MSDQLREQLQELSKVWATSEPKVNKGSGSIEELPDGFYQMEVQKVVMKPTRAGDKLMVAWDFRVISGDMIGRHYFDNQVLNERTIPHVRGRLNTMGADVAQLPQLHKALEAVTGTRVNVKLRTDSREGSDFRYLDVNSVITNDDDAAEAALTRGVVDAAAVLRGTSTVAAPAPSKAPPTMPVPPALPKRGPGRPPKPKAPEAAQDNGAVEDQFAGLWADIEGGK